MAGFFQKVFHLFGKKEQVENQTKATPHSVASDTLPLVDSERLGSNLSVAQAPESLCGITATMSVDEIRSELAKLYKRYNQAAASLNMEMRQEAEMMLDAIVACREKYLSA